MGLIAICKKDKGFEKNTTKPIEKLAYNHVNHLSTKFFIQPMINDELQFTPLIFLHSSILCVIYIAIKKLWQRQPTFTIDN